MPSQKTSPTILAMCCLCDQVAEDGSQPPSGWTALETYVQDHAMTPSDYQLSHTYCPTCYSQQARAWHIPPRAA